jgi:hypothetical protein
VEFHALGFVMINSLLVVIPVLGFLCNLLTYLIIDSLLVTTLNLKITDIVQFDDRSRSLEMHWPNTLQIDAAWSQPKV